MPQTSIRRVSERCLAGVPTTATRSTRSRRRRGLRRTAPVPGRTRQVLGESFRSCGLRSFGFAGQVAHELDVGPQRQAVPQLRLSLFYGRAMELRLADVLDGLISRPGGGQRPYVNFRVGELPRERNVHALDRTESVRRQELLAR